MSALTETQERFLRDASTRLPMDRVREVYVFAPMRQGGMETGVAVIAVALEPEAAVDTAPDVADAAAAEDARAAVDEPVSDVLEEDVADVADVSTADAAPDAAIDPMPDAPAEALVDAGDETPMEEAERVSADAEMSVADAEPAIETRAEAADGRADAESAAPETAPEPDASVRYTVLTARYRLQLKGPDRGKWEVDMVEEADAPLLTVDAVVRGVQRRAGDENEAERLTAADFLAVVSGQATWPATR
ncbi:MAG TPA: hypothetical protein VHQ45_10850 [Gemmatimonadaceae bacterium]|nr:hypothetical protein [Gemmatimonadaceae bacterium]